MPYASGPSVRRLSKIATLLLARNYIVMLQRTVDELRRLLVQSPNHQRDTSTSSPAPVGLQSPRPYHGAEQSAGAQSQSPASTPRVVADSCVVPQPAAELILAMTSLPPVMADDRLMSHLSSQRVGDALSWSAAAAVSWQRTPGYVPLTTDSAAFIAGSRRGLLLPPWTDPIPLTARRLPPL